MSSSPKCLIKLTSFERLVLELIKGMIQKSSDQTSLRLTYEISLGH